MIERFRAFLILCCFSLHSSIFPLFERPGESPINLWEMVMMFPLTKATNPSVSADFPLNFYVVRKILAEKG